MVNLIDKASSNFISSNFEQDSVKDQLTYVNNTIFELERSIADLNRNYKNLLIKLNVNYINAVFDKFR
jgi:hypothetical protein